MTTPLDKAALSGWRAAARILLCCFIAPGISPGAEAAGKTASPKPGPSAAAQEGAVKWKSMFDGGSLAGWKITDFAGHGEVAIKGGRIVLESGVMTGITWTNELPRSNYEISLEAMRVTGSDFFCGLTFPVGADPCSLIVGGWGGGVVGLSSLDGEDAAHNETTRYMNFANGRWFQVRVRVANQRIQAWIDAEQVVDVSISGRKVSIRVELEDSKPLGIASWSTTAALRNIKIRGL